MTMPAYAHAQQAPVTLEAERERLHAEDRTLTAGKKRFALAFYAMKVRWDRLYPAGSDRQFILWYLMPGKYNGSFQNSLDAGLALSRGFTDLDWRLGEVSEAGGALRDGDSAADIRARRDAGVPVRRRKNLNTRIEIPAVLADEIMAIRDGVSQSDSLSAAESTARVILGYGGQDAPVRDAIRDRDATGRTLLSALSAAHAPEQHDYRTALKKRSACIRCGVAHGIELHHQMVDANDRHRTHNYLVPLCRACHQARPGDDTAIHAKKFEEIKGDSDYWRKAFIALADAAEATRPNTQEAL